MSIWSNMITALRGGINEAGEAIIDTQAMRILDQEVRDSTLALNDAKDKLAKFVATQKVAEENIVDLQQSIAEYEGYIEQALAKEDQALALEVAQKIADFENQLTTERSIEQKSQQQARELRLLVKQAEQNIKRLKHQIDTVKAMESVQRAQAAVAERRQGDSSKLPSAVQSLARIRQKQAEQAVNAETNAEHTEQSSPGSLEQRLQQAGIMQSGSSAEEILERVKNRHS